MVSTIVDGMVTMSSPFDILLIGQIGVGKTTLLRKYVMGTYDEPNFELSECLVYKSVEMPYCCQDPRCASFENSSNKQVSILDSSAAVDTLLTHNSHQVKNAQTMVFAYSTASSDSFESLEYTINCIESVRDTLPPCVVVGLKPQREEFLQVLASQGEELAKSCGALLFSEANLYDANSVDEVFAPLIDLVLRKEKERNHQIKQPLLSKIPVQMSSDSVLITRNRSADAKQEKDQISSKKIVQNLSRPMLRPFSGTESTPLKENDEGNDENTDISVHQDLMEKYSDFGNHSENSVGSTRRSAGRLRSNQDKSTSTCCIIM